jgi:hypothetical protein
MRVKNLKSMECLAKIFEDYSKCYPCSDSYFLFPVDIEEEFCGHVSFSDIKRVGVLVFPQKFMAITELLYTLHSKKKVNWSVAQEKSISTDYPFEIHAEPLEQYVARTYLQFLWLPPVSSNDLIKTSYKNSFKIFFIVHYAATSLATLINTRQHPITIRRVYTSNARVFGSVIAYNTLLYQ